MAAVNIRTTRLGVDYVLHVFVDGALLSSTEVSAADIIKVRNHVAEQAADMPGVSSVRAGKIPAPKRTPAAA